MSLVCPSLIVIGGSLAEISPAFVALIRSFIKSRKYPDTVKRIKVEQSVLGNTGCSRGAVMLAPDAFLDWYIYLGTGKILGIPFPAIVLIVVFFFFWFLTEKTTLGRQIYAVGGNAEAARLNGISVWKTRAFVMVYKMHFDIGFTDYVVNVVQKYHTSFIDGALNAIEESSSLPTEEQFKWTLPGWPLIGCNPATTPPNVPPIFWWEGPDGSRIFTVYSKDYGVVVLPSGDWNETAWLGMQMTGDDAGPPSIGTVQNDINTIKNAGLNYKIGSMMILRILFEKEIRHTYL